MEQLTERGAGRAATRQAVVAAVAATSCASARTSEVGEDAARSSSPTRRRSTRCARARRSTDSLDERHDRHRRRRRLRRPRRPTCSASAQHRPLARSRSARHARRRPRLRHGGQARASPKSNVIIIYGDGSFGLHAMEFEACVRQKINVVGVIGNDAALDADPPRPGADLRRGAHGRDGSSRSRATIRWSRRSAGTASTSSSPRRSARRSSARSAAGKPALVNIKHRAAATSARTRSPSERGAWRAIARRRIIVIGNEILSGKVDRHQLAVPRRASCARSASTLRRIVVIPDELDDDRRARCARCHADATTSCSPRAASGRRTTTSRSRASRAASGARVDPPPRASRASCASSSGQGQRRRGSRWPRCPRAPS